MIPVKQTPLLTALKYATLLTFGMLFAIMAAGVFNSIKLSASLTDRTGQIEKDVPTMVFDASRVMNGFTAPADTNVIFTVPSNTTITRVTLLGGELNDEKRYWGYCRSGNEDANKQKGYTGRKLYDGRFFYSKGERHSNPDSSDLASEIEIFKGDEVCYLMAASPLPIGIDRDRDEVNDRLERDVGSDPTSADSDGDSLPDNLEVFVMKTSPIRIDTDQDGLPDYAEDANHNGHVDAGETSALSADTDRDGLCDGDGTANACPEGYQSPVRGEDVNQNGVVDPGETDPKKWDTDGNGVNDKDQRQFEYENSR